MHQEAIINAALAGEDALMPCKQHTHCVITCCRIMLLVSATPCRLPQKVIDTKTN